MTDTTEWKWMLDSYSGKVHAWQPDPCRAGVCTAACGVATAEVYLIRRFIPPVCPRCEALTVPAAEDPSTAGASGPRPNACDRRQSPDPG